MTQAFPRFGVAKNASLDLLIEPPRGVRRGSFDADLEGVCGTSTGAVLTFLADRASSWGSLFSLSELSETVSSFRFLPSASDEASLFRTMRIVPVEGGPKLIGLSDLKEKAAVVLSVAPPKVRRRDGEAEAVSVPSGMVGYSTELPRLG